MPCKLARISSLASLGGDAQNSPRRWRRLVLAARGARALLAASARHPPKTSQSEARSQGSEAGRRCSERKGVLTTTISQLRRRRSTGCTGEVAAIRNQRGGGPAPGSTPSRPSSTGRSAAGRRQGPPGRDARPPEARTGRAARAAGGDVRDRHARTCSASSSAPTAYDDLVDRSRIPQPHPRQGRSDRRPRARTARRGQAHGRSPARGARTGSKRRATRSPPKSRRWRAPAPRCRAASGAGRRPRRARSGAGDRSREHEEELDGDVAAIQAKIAAQLARDRLGAAAGRARSSGGSGGADLAGRRPGRLRLRPAHDRRQLRVPPGDRHRRAGRARRSAPRRPAPSSFTEPEADSGGYGNYTCIDHGGGLSTCYAHQSTFAVARRAAGLARARSSATAAAPATASAPTSTSRSGSTAKSTDPMGYL